MTIDPTTINVAGAIAFGALLVRKAIAIIQDHRRHLTTTIAHDVTTEAVAVGAELAELAPDIEPAVTMLAATARQWADTEYHRGMREGFSKGTAEAAGPMTPINRDSVPGFGR